MKPTRLRLLQTRRRGVVVYLVQFNVPEYVRSRGGLCLRFPTLYNLPHTAVNARTSGMEISLPCVLVCSEPKRPGFRRPSQTCRRHRYTFARF